MVSKLRFPLFFFFLYSKPILNRTLKGESHVGCLWQLLTMTMQPSKLLSSDTKVAIQLGPSY